MKNSILFFSFFFMAISLFSQTPTVKFYLDDGSSKEFKVEDIKSLTFNKTVLPYSMSVFKKESTVISIDTKNIDSIVIKENLYLNVFQPGKTEIVNLTEIDSIIFEIKSPDEIRIGTQVYMSRNLDVSTYNNGDTIRHCPSVSDWLDAKNKKEGAWCYYNNDPAVGGAFGKLYNWYAVNDSRGLAPDGWVIPNENDCIALMEYLGGDSIAGGKLKESGVNHWDTPNTGATNQSGFTALPGGWRGDIYSLFYNLRANGYWWLSTEIDTSKSFGCYLSFFSTKLIKDQFAKENGFSVRCLKRNPGKSISLKYPNGGEVFNSHDKIEISWTQNLINNIKIELSTNNGIDWITITNSAEAYSGLYNWYVLSLPSAFCKIRISDAEDPLTFDQSDSTFSIELVYNDDVIIGNQVWMRRNLDVSFYRNGDPIPQVQDSAQWANLETGAWCYYNNDPNLGAVYGKLYNWPAIMDKRGLAPEGWHIPDYNDWDQLANFLGGTDIAGGKMKEFGTLHWVSPNDGATNESEFTAIPGGYVYKSGFGGIGKYSYWWTFNPWQSAWYGVSIQISTSNLRIHSGKDITKPQIGTGYSVRCISDKLISNPTIIDSIYPDNGNIGDEVIIYGNRFGNSRNNSIVSFNGIEVKEYISWENNIVKVLVPDGVSNGNIYVKVNSVRSNGVFFYLKEKYDSIFIGNKIWMGRNLNVDYYQNGDKIKYCKTEKDWSNAITNHIGAWCYYNFSTLYGSIYGKLYNWYALNDPRGLAPKGWHIPDDTEWTVLSNSLGGAAIAGAKLKEQGTSHWNEPNTDATNESKFSALPGGWYQNSKYFYDIGNYGSWWSATSYKDSYAGVWKLSYSEPSLYHNFEGSECFKSSGHSVRCLIGQPPKVLSINPTKGNIGDVITINGSDFGGERRSNYVLFNNVFAKEYIQWSNNLIKVKMPDSVTSGKISVYVWGEISNEVDFAYNIQYGSVTDNDNRKYKTVKIGNQWWMAENLNVEHYNNGDPIPQVQDSAQWAKLNTGAWCYYNGDPAKGEVYGKLYNWYAVNDPRGLAPEGWHIPSEEELTNLSDYLGGNDISGGKLKSTGSTEDGKGLWISPNKGATNGTGFNALPGGLRGYRANYVYIGSQAYFWSSTSDNSTMSRSRILENTQASFINSGAGKNCGISVRCIKD